MFNGTYFLQFDTKLNKINYSASHPWNKNQAIKVLIIKYWSGVVQDYKQELTLFHFPLNSL